MAMRFLWLLFSTLRRMASFPFIIMGMGSAGSTSASGRCLALVLSDCGGAFPKFGQILSTRPDLLPASICAELDILQDQMPPLKPARIDRLARSAFNPWPFEYFDPNPDACATIAQVHRAIVAQDGREVALKILRPGVAKDIDTDCRLALTASPLVRLLPAMRGVPVAEAIQEAGIALRRQTDFRREAENLARLRQDFIGFPGVLVPAVDRHLSSNQVICMDYVTGLRKLTDPSIPDQKARELIRLGLKCLYRMIFETGFVHCDLHPGNLMVSTGGQLVILDGGLITELDESTRTLFAEFFATIALKNGRRASEIVKITASSLPANLDHASFDAEISGLIKRTGGLSAEFFHVTAFVSELFEIQARHHIRGTSRFSLIILALLVYEGIAKQRHRTLDFQKEALPFVLAAMLKV